MRKQPERRPLADATAGHWTLASLIEAAEPKSNASSISTARQLLVPILLNAFLESAPIAFAPATPTSSTDVHFQTVLAVAQIARELYRGRDATQTEIRSLRGLVNRLESYFPFAADDLQARDLQTETAIQQLNLLFCELVAVVVENGPSDSKIVSSLERVGQYVTTILSGAAISPAQPLGQTLTSAAYLSLVPTVWALLCQPGADAVFAAVLEHHGRLSVSSAIKRPSLELITRLLSVRGSATRLTLRSCTHQATARVSRFRRRSRTSTLVYRSCSGSSAIVKSGPR